MTAVETPPCTGGHDSRGSWTSRLIDLPCGCQDVHYTDGTTCFEHNHAQCDGAPETTATEGGAP